MMIPGVERCDTQEGEMLIYQIKEVDLRDDKFCRIVDDLKYLAWGTPLTPDQFHRRESALRQTPLAHQGLVVFCVVVPSQVAGGSDQIVATCELWPVSRTNDQGEKKEGRILASLVVNPHFRGKGLATKLVNHALQFTSQQTALEFILLYSEVDPSIYEKCGFQIIPSKALTIEVPSQKITNDDDISAVAVFDFYEADRLWKNRNLLALLNSITPEKAQFQWQYTRSGFYPPYLHCPAQKNYLYTSDGLSVWCLHDPKSKILYVLSIQGQENPKSMEIILKRMLIDAQVLTATQVEIWVTGELSWIEGGASAVGVTKISKIEDEPMICNLKAPLLPQELATLRVERMAWA